MILYLSGIILALLLMPILSVEDDDGVIVLILEYFNDIEKQIKKGNK